MNRALAPGAIPPARGIVRPPVGLPPSAAAPRRRRIDGALARALQRLELGYATTALFLFTQGIVAVVTSTTGPQAIGVAQEGNPTMRAIFSAIHATTLLLVVARARTYLPILRRNKALFAMLAWAMVSVAWTALPDLTLRRAAALLGTMLFGIYLGTTYPVRVQLRMIAVITAFAAVMSAVFAIALPQWGLDRWEYVGAWRGIFTHKNELGQVMAIGGAALILLWGDVRRGRWLVGALIGVVFVVILLSQSQTSALILATLAALRLAYGTLRLQPTLSIGVVTMSLVIAAAVATTVVGNRVQILGALGRDPTLTGRTELWSEAVRAGSDHALVGAGYRAFWSVQRGGADQIRTAVGWNAPNAHNGYLDLWLELGLVGIALLAVGFGVAFARSVRLLRRDPAAAAYWPLLLLSFMLIYNFSESVLLASNGFAWVLFTAATVYAGLADPPGRWLGPARRGRPAPASAA